MKRLEMKVLVTSLAVLALAAGGCGGSNGTPTEEQAAPAPKPKNPVDVIEVGAAPTAVTISDGAVWVVRNQGDTPCGSSHSPGRWSTSRFPPGKARSARRPRRCRLGDEHVRQHGHSDRLTLGPCRRRAHSGR